MKDKKDEALPIVCAILQDSNEMRTDKYEADWNGFWQFYNLMQSSDNFIGVTTEGMQEMVYGKLPIVDSQIQDTGMPMPFETDGWSTIKEELYDDEAYELADKLQSMNVKVPSSVGYELTNPNGVVIAECEMAWEEEKVAALLMEQIENKIEFENAGWMVFTLNDSVPAKIKGVIN